MSSKMASAVTNTMSACGTRLPSSVSTPMQKAMSVAIGMPQPAAPGVPRLKARKIAAGTTMPPDRGDRGSAARRQVRSSPDDELALDLHAHDEEEDRHQPVVDDLVQVDPDHPAGELE